MELRDYIRVLHKRWRLILLCTLLAIAGALAITQRATPLYRTSVGFFVSTSDQSAQANSSNAYTGGLFSQQRVKSYAAIAAGPLIAERVAALLPSGTRSIDGHITAAAVPDTVLLNVSVTDPTPRRALAIAQGVGREFPLLVAELEKPSSGAAAPIRVSVIQQPVLPGRAFTPQPIRNLSLALVLGLLLGVGVAVLREVLDTTIHGSQEAETLVGAPMLGVINFDPDGSKNPLVVARAPNSPRAETFRQLRTNLQFVDIQHAVRSVVITSSVPNEGKSTTTCNLGIALAQAGVHVVIVEGDLRRPRVADYMGVEGAVGLTSVLLGRSTLDDALQPWGSGIDLQVLSSGPLPPNPSELLGSQGMADLLTALEDRADIVIFDAPPLLPVTDAAVLGTMTSGVIMLIRSHSTRREQVARAVATINAVNATILGAVLNMVPTRGPDSYSYHYGYSRAPSSEKTDREAMDISGSGDTAPPGGSPRLSGIAPEQAEQPSHSFAELLTQRPTFPLEPSTLSSLTGDETTDLSLSSDATTPPTTGREGLFPEASNASQHGRHSL